MDLYNLKLSRSSELFPSEAVENSSHILHDEAVRKAMSAEKPTRKCAKKIHFSQSMRQQQSAKHPSLTTSSKTLDCPSSSGSSSGSKTFSSSSQRVKGKKF